jgi:hypothetical protein
MGKEKDTHKLSYSRLNKLTLLLEIIILLLNYNMNKSFENKKKQMLSNKMTRFFSKEV